MSVSVKSYKEKAQKQGRVTNYVCGGRRYYFRSDDQGRPSEDMTSPEFRMMWSQLWSKREWQVQRS